MQSQRAYFTFYCDSYELVMAQLGRVARDVLVALAQHADARGLCWPGVGRLAALVHVADESVRNALSALEAADFIRRHERYSSVRRRWEFESYQISPHIMPIRPELEAEAWALWNAEKRNVIVTNEIKESQPSSRTIFNTTTSSNQRQEPPPQPPPKNQPTPESGEWRAERRDYTNQPEGKDTGKDTGKDQEPDEMPTSANGATPARSAAAPNGAKTPPPRSAPPPAPDAGALKPFAEALADPDRETAAQSLYVAVPALQIAKARQLIQVYGVDQIDTALAHLRRQPDTLANPAGWLIAKLREMALVEKLDGKGKPDAPDDDYESGDGNAYMSGKYGAFIKH